MIYYVIHSYVIRVDTKCIFLLFQRKKNYIFVSFVRISGKKLYNILPLPPYRSLVVCVYSTNSPVKYLSKSIQILF